MNPALPRNLALPLALALALAAPRPARAGSPATAGASTGAGAPAVRPASDAARLALEVGKGGPVVLHFWATWCAACEGEFARLGGLLASLPKRGVAVALVSIDGAETRDRVPAELRRLGVSALPSLILDAPDPGPVAAGLHEPRWDGTLPATFVFDRRGKKVASFLGTTTPARLAKAVRAASAP